MIRRSKISAALLAATLLAALPGGVHAQAQGRFKVLIPDFEPMQGANKKFGQKSAEELRTLMNGLLTHQPVAKKDMEKALKKYKLKMDQLDCAKTRQLAAQIDAQVALCASYVQQGNDYVVKAAFWDTRSNESFTVNPVTAGEKAYDAAAKGIFNQFDQYTTELRAAGNCQSYATSQQYKEALGQCNKALGINPKAQKTRYLKAHILYDMKNYDASLAELDSLLAENPIQEDALQLAGYICGLQGNSDKAVDYYSRYLQLQPKNAQVRMNVAYNLASKAGDPAGAARLIQAGLDLTPDNVDLLEQYGGFAFAAGKKIADAASKSDSADGGGLPPEAADYYRKAIDAYQKVYAKKGADTPSGELKTMIAAYVELNEVNQAISTAEKALQTHPDDDDIWSYYADALHKDGQLDKALTALARVKEINPNHANVGLRQGQWLIQAGRVTDAVDALKAVAQADPQQADMAAKLVFADAYSKGIQKKDYAYAMKALDAALTLPNLQPSMVHQLTFWDGYSVYQKAFHDQQPQTLATAKATLPEFQRAKKMLSQDGIGAYAKSVNVDINQMKDNLDTFIDIQQKIIKRGR